MDLTGETLGQFRIIEPIGQGGMASVFKAYQPSLDRYVAIKVLPAQHALTPGFSERFVREARAIAQLSHPNILPVIDFGQDGDLSYIVMKFVPAGTLKNKMGRAMDLEEASRLVDRIAAALDHAHERGILHRDIKPSNVLLDVGDWVLLADFGLAKMVAGDEGLTGSGVGIGTPAYMSPEQGQGSEVDARTDIYSLGVILYEMVTGRLPYDAETPFAIVMKHITEPLPLPRSVRPELPEAVERVILRAMAKDPQDRFETAGDLARALSSAILPLTPEEFSAPVETLEETVARLPNLYTQALGFFYTEQWARAIENLETIVGVQPDYEDGDAARRLEQAREQMRLTGLYTEVQAALDVQNWTAAIAGLDEIVATDPGYRDATSLLKQARGRKELADLYGDARRLHASGQWQAVINVWERIQGVDPNYPDPEALVVSAQSELAQAQAELEARRRAEERSRHLADLYRRGLAHITADEWQEATTVFEEIQSVEPDYEETAALLERARREIGALEAPPSVEPETEPWLSVLLETLPLDLLRERWQLVAGGLAAIVVAIIVIVAVTNLISSEDESASAAAQQDQGGAGTVMLDRVLVSDRDGKREIYRVAESGQVRWTYTAGEWESWSPTFGPDNVLYFTSDRDGKREIYRMDKTGAVVRWTYTADRFESWSPALGPDDALFFTSDRDGRREIYRMDKTGAVIRWTHTPGEFGSWSPALGPDDTLVFTSDRDGKREIYRMDKTGAIMRWTYTPGGFESWSPILGPDDTLLFTSDRDGKREVYRMDKTGAVARWTYSPGESESWSPVLGADNMLYFTSDRDGKREVYRIDHAGEVERVTHTPEGGESWLSTAE
jgi:tetratricopeptide (TPR) repeat protein